MFSSLPTEYLCFVGMTFAVVVGLLLLINAAYMLISPKKWFELPSFIRATGTLTKQRYSEGFGAVEVRITGLIMMGIVLWVVYDVLISSH